MHRANSINSRSISGRAMNHLVVLLTATSVIYSCSQSSETGSEPVFRHHVIFDTDANNEIDDQHALAYLLFSGDAFAVEGITVNATTNPEEGGMAYSHVSEHYDEAKRIMQLCGVFGEIPLLTGVTGSFEDIKDDLESPGFDGHEAVNFIIEQSLKKRDQELILIPVGKLTNIALALKKEPAIAENIRIVWLGSNYPAPGEHNQVWDIGAMNYILDTEVRFEMVTVRYGNPSGTDAVKVTKSQILHRMPGKGPLIPEPVRGRHGGEFNNWGDYSVNLFEKYGAYGNPPSRPLFDQAAVAIVKNPAWAEKYEHPAPIYIDDQWVERPDNKRTITIWEWYDIYGIINDFFAVMDNPVIVEGP
jgi:purine nucleosidase